MRTPLTALVVLAATTGAASTAHALKQSRHAAITEELCESAGFDHDFCERVADEVYNTDYHEFLDLAAHAQPDPGKTRCEAARASVTRMRDRGREARAAFQRVAANPRDVDSMEAAARALGRALHTVQDNCAHEGMTNPQHAWHSLSDSCEGTEHSPDIQPSAYACAESETAEIFAAVAGELHAMGVDPAELDAWEVYRHWPPRGEVCAFLVEAADWDGRDQRWRSDLIVPALRTQLLESLAGNDAAEVDVCAGGPSSLDRDDWLPPADVSSGGELCKRVQLYCLGKADDVDEPPPWATADDEAETSEARGGCSAAAGTRPDGGAALVLLLGAAGLLARGLRRRRA